MRSSIVWRKVFGWQVGDFFKYYYTPQRTVKGIWIKLRIIDSNIKDDFVKVRTLKKYRNVPREFHIRVSYVELSFPDFIKNYFPRKETIKNFEQEQDNWNGHL